MNTLLVILGMQISVLEIVIFQLGAVILGFFIHFFITSKKNIKVEQDSTEREGISEADEWRLKYYEELDMHERKFEQLQKAYEKAKAAQEDLEAELDDLKASEEEIQKELDDLKTAELHLRQELDEASETEAELIKENDKIREELLRYLEQPVPVANPLPNFMPPPVEQVVTPNQEPLQNAGYLQQLKQTQENLMAQNKQINLLLDQIELQKNSEHQLQEAMKTNEQMQQQMRELRKGMMEKDNELRQLRQQQGLTKELQDRLDKVYTEFFALQGKLMKVETQIIQPQQRGFEYDELQEAYFRISKDYDEQKGKYLQMLEDNQRLARIITDTEEKLREAEHQRQKLSKKVDFLTELSEDLSQVEEQSKRVQGQLRRIGELEELLARYNDQSNPSTQP
jgi:chromosome segregation ATPase